MTKEETKEYNNQYHLDNLEKIKEFQKQYYLDNKEKLNEYKKQYYLDNKEKKIEINKQYYLDNKEKSKQYYLDNKEEIKQYRLDNKEKKKKYDKQYKLDNKEKINEYQKNRRDSEPLFKLTGNIRCLIGMALTNKGYTKKSNTHQILGCEYDFFASYLDLSKYNEDSHLDHVIPISLADTEEEALLLNHYSNFQLLTAEDNLLKGNRYIKIENYMRVLHNHPNPKKLKEIVNRSEINIQ